MEALRIKTENWAEINYSEKWNEPKTHLKYFKRKTHQLNMPNDFNSDSISSSWPDLHSRTGYGLGPGLAMALVLAV